MKFRNLKTGEVFDVRKSTWQDYMRFFCKTVNCDACRIGRRLAPGELCSDWVNSHPYAAAGLMGYEVIEERNEVARPKPPIGVMPEKLWKEQRLEALCSAIGKYEICGIEPPEEWKKEGARLYDDIRHNFRY